MTVSDFLNTQTMGGYLVCFIVAGGLIYNYSSKKKPAQIAKSAKAAVEPKKDTNAKKQRKAAFTSQKPEEKASTSAVEPSGTWLSNDPKEDVDNAEFAKRMASVKEGKKFDGKASADAKKKKTKSVKQSRAAEKKPAEVTEEEEELAASSARAVEAVEEAEESSPAASPEVTPADPSGVSDMLEPTASGPSVLRLTGTDKEKPKPKNQKAPEQAETKKQRQNRQKVEAKRAAREEEEKERKIKLEKQRRTAREAAGIPAKDGSQFMASVNGNKSAWTAGSPNGASTNGTSAAVQPLDTFEAPAKNGTSAAPAQTSNNWISSLPSEEEQMERLKEEDEWNTVPAKSKKTKKETRSPSPEAVKPAAAAAPARPVAQAVQKPASNGKAAKPVQSNFGSFSALSTEEEEEWDV
ncbi:hypothetical protein CORC01_11068 [Colletotrichum orchidophilum]|uniref:Uncharacterized protein n=1 Tax=Colletotrichum orchidophilum TaxID=1209926 RepID=A0A1G4AX28_9PEZI|nr:uncharacterized protein CORC01_11068 [Colletotrichum orchidophilum]OHE93665.1 hypothetical protein CORC01_11068 [Colletotrichum orchidophilum]